MSGLIRANQLFNVQSLQALTGQQRKTLDTALETVQNGGDQHVNAYFQLAADKIKADPKKYSVAFGNLPERGNGITYGMTETLQTGPDEPVQGAKITLNAKRLFAGSEEKQLDNIVGTLGNELCSKHTASDSFNHEMVSDLSEAHMLKALEQGKTGKKGNVSGQAIVEQANKQRGGSLQNMRQLGAYADKPDDKADTTLSKMQALGLVNQEQAQAMAQAAGITRPRPIDNSKFKPVSAGSQLSLDA
jgi:hypothetical protein